LIIRSGGGHFRACLRRSVDQGWLWALEWNKSLRTIGAICLPNEILWPEAFPTLKWLILPDGSRLREEKAEPDMGSTLFPEALDPPPLN